jgi:hypothetical protein
MTHRNHAGLQQIPWKNPPPRDSNVGTRNPRRRISFADYSVGVLQCLRSVGSPAARRRSNLPPMPPETARSVYPSVKLLHHYPHTPGGVRRGVPSNSSSRTRLIRGGRSSRGAQCERGWGGEWERDRYGEIGTSRRKRKKIVCR